MNIQPSCTPVSERHGTKDSWFALKAVQTFEFGGVNKHITFSRFLPYQGVIIQLQYKVLFK